VNSGVEISDDLEPMDDFEGSCSSDEECSENKPTIDLIGENNLLDLD